MMNSLFKQASRDGASDIHLEAYEKQSIVRFRVDGDLRDVVDLKRGLHSALVSRIKIMASLDIAEKRMPQDGRISLRVGNKALDIRVSTLPTAHGERVVMRLLEKNYSKLDLKIITVDLLIIARYRDRTVSVVNFLTLFFYFKIYKSLIEADYKRF